METTGQGRQLDQQGNTRGRGKSPETRGEINFKNRIEIHKTTDKQKINMTGFPRHYSNKGKKKKPVNTCEYL